MDEAGHFIAKKDWPDFALLMAEFRAVGKTLRRPPPPGERRPGRGGRVYFGKPASSFTEGALTAPNNVVTLWLSPGHDDGPAATTRTITAHWSTGNFSTSDYVIVTPLHDGTRHVSCYPSGS
jgi:hypothetical protein